MFRQVSEEQRRMSEGRYRGVLLEAVQDAVYLSAHNQELQADNKQLRKGQCVFLNLDHIGCYIIDRASANPSDKMWKKCQDMILPSASLLKILLFLFQPWES